MSPFLPISDTMTNAVGMVSGTNSTKAIDSDTDSHGKTFGQLLQAAINNVNSLQVNANEQAEAYATGKTSDLHSVMIASEEASISLELATQVRNKVVDAYQEIMRMTV